MRKRLGDNLTPVIKYWIFLIGIITTIFVVIFASFAASYLNLPPAEQTHAEALFAKLIPFPFIGSIILVTFICTMVSLLFQYYIIPVLKMAEQTRLITTANPEYRITTKGALELRILADVINESADVFQKLQNEVDERIHQSSLELKEERNRFVALMSELPYGVVVCNTDGQIMLYNLKAQEMLQPTEQEQKAGGTIGLGRSIFEVLDRDPLSHALEIINHTFAKEQAKPLLGFMTKLCQERFIRVNMAPVTSLDEETGTISGFVLSLEDITGEIEADNERDQQLQKMIDAVQKSLGSIHHGIDSICNMPSVGNEICNQHRTAIEQVSNDLEVHLALARNLYSKHRNAYGNRENVLTDSLLAILVKSIQDRFDLEVVADTTQTFWLKIDSYAVVQALTNLAGRLKAEHNIQRLQLHIDADDEQFIKLIINWPNQPVSCQTINDWQMTPLFIDNNDTPDSPQTIATKHGGTILIEAATTGLCNALQLTLPIALTDEAEALPPTANPRPVSYEFDLFHQPEQETLGQIPLRKLTYVVFDAETTGLNPSDGDEIIQIGAVRIVNQHLLLNETIDQLVNPQRPVPKSSVAIHGIQPELLETEPTIGEVLPVFHSFAKDAVLVAHNAAFDMRCLQLKEEATGLRFDNPVLDTLLLSSVVHPNQEGHSLDAIAERFNIRVVGRHTAIGDALVTADIFLKILPLLEAQGINTLDDALNASIKSPFNKIKY